MIQRRYGKNVSVIQTPGRVYMPGEMDGVWTDDRIDKEGVGHAFERVSAVTAADKTTEDRKTRAEKVKAILTKGRP